MPAKEVKKPPVTKGGGAKKTPYKTGPGAPGSGKPKKATC